MNLAVSFRISAVTSLLIVSSFALAQNPGPMGPICRAGQMRERTRFTIFDGHDLLNKSKQRWWRKVKDGRWQEVYPNGYVTTLKEEGPLVLNGVSGTLMRKGDDPAQEVFLPSTNSCDYRLFWRTTGVAWRNTADIIEVAPPPSVSW